MWIHYPPKTNALTMDCFNRGHIVGDLLDVGFQGFGTAGDLIAFCIKITFL